jgi:parallel beta-helix repeat protein
VKNLPLLWICLSLAVPSQARTIVVADKGPGDFKNIQAAINKAVDGDTVIVADGIYTGPRNRGIDFGGRAITVRSQNGPEVTIIDCQRKGRGFHFHRGEDGNSVLDGFTIRNGYPVHGDGAGILCEDSSPTIQNCIIRDNQTRFHKIFPGVSADGAGTAVGRGSPMISGRGGKTPFLMRGGAVSCVSSGATIRNCVITGNLAHCGGGINCSSCNLITNLTIVDCTITDNEAEYCGGGVYVGNSGSVSIENCRISGNSAWFGGGIDCGWSGPTITNCVISENTASHHHFTGAGGGILGGGSSTIINCTIVANYTDGIGGGICWSRGDMALINSILWGNTAYSPSAGAEIALGFSGGAAVSYCDVKGGQAGVYVGACSLNWLIGNIEADPCFVYPNNGDHHLKSQGWRWDCDANQWTWDDVTSRCIDAGNPGSPLGEEPITLDVDPLNRFGKNLRINMGAYGGTERASMPPYDWDILSDITNDGTVDFIDFAYLAAIYADEDDELPADFDRDGDVDLGDFGLLVEDWLKETSWYE